MNTENKNMDKSPEDTEKKPQESSAGTSQPNYSQNAPGGGRNRDKDGKGKKPFAKKREIVPSEFLEQVVSINRITKVTKGGKKMSFSALVVVGDGKGKVGYSLDKANEVATAIKKSLAAAKRSMIKIPLHNSTIPHQIIGVCGGAKVLLKPAAEGTGVIAAGPVRAVCDSVGIRNILTKCHRSNNPINVVKATIDGLSRLKSTSYALSQAQAQAQAGVAENVPS